MNLTQLIILEKKLKKKSYSKKKKNSLNVFSESVLSIKKSLNFLKSNELLSCYLMFTQ